MESQARGLSAGPQNDSEGNMCRQHLSIICLLVTALGGSSAARGETGLITGIVRLQGAAPKASALPVARDTAACGKEVPNESVVVGSHGELANVVVFLKDVAVTSKPAPVDGATLDQRRCRYIPHVQALTVGTPLSLMNNDAVLHNVHANDATLTVFNVAMPIKGQKLPVTLRRPGLMKLQCDAGHTWMNAWIYVFDHPYYAVTDATGAFTIRDVPAGSYTVEVWHEPVSGGSGGSAAGVRSTAKVTVRPAATARLDLTLAL